MPDISMCPSRECPLRSGCYRNEASGTEPNERRQAWTAYTWRIVAGGDHVICDGYDPLLNDSRAEEDPPISGSAHGL